MSDDTDMNMEQLAEDWKGLRVRVKDKLTAMATSADIAAVLRNEILPFFDNLVQQSVEMDGCIEDMMYKQEDVLQPESASIFAAVIVGGMGMADRLEALSIKGPDGALVDAALGKALVEYRNLCKGAEHLIAEITLPEEPDDDEDPDDEGEGDEEDPDDEGDEDDDETTDETEGDPQ